MVRLSQRIVFFYLSSTSFATSQDRVKGAKKLGGGLSGARLLHSSLSPVGAMSHDPIEQGLFKTDVAARLFALDPFVFQNLLALSKELLVEHRILDEPRSLFSDRHHGEFFFHKIENRSTKMRRHI